MDRLGIGEFAHASGLTAKALRLYDELGLLVPAQVDPRSGYRSYDHAQLDRARLIAALRGVGMPLARIRVVCALAPRAGAVEVRSYWRQVEADTRARADQVGLLIDDLFRKDTTVTGDDLAFALDHAARTDRGLVRPTHRDAAFGGTRLFAVADGFGTGHDAGTEALDALAALDVEPPGDPVAALEAGTRAAGAAVRALAAASSPTPSDANGALVSPSGAKAPFAPGGTGTTLTAMLWSGSRFGVTHVGDTRIYLLRDGELDQITHDHTYVRSLVDEGRLTPEEAATHPERATLLRAVTGEDVEPDLHLREGRPGDRYLLCSDGLHAVVGDGCLQDVLGRPADAATTVDELVRAALDAGGPDNVACVVVDVLGRS